MKKMKFKFSYLLLALFVPCLAFSQNVEKESIEKDKSITVNTKSSDEIKLQIKSLGQKYNCKSDYDRFSDEGFAVCSIELIGFGESFGKIFAGGLTGKTPADTPSFEINVGFGFKTNKLAKDIEDFLIVVKTADTQWKLLKNSKFYAIADDERFEFGSGELIDADFKVNTIPGARGLEIGTSETVSFRLTREQLVKLAQANSTEIRIGTREQKFKKKQQEILKSILTLSTVSEKVSSEKKK